MQISYFTARTCDHCSCPCSPGWASAPAPPTELVRARRYSAHVAYCCNDCGDIKGAASIDICPPHHPRDTLLRVGL